MQLFPQLRKLEEKYPNSVVVIGVHSPKFPAERELGMVRDAVRRYEIEHPVVNDPDHLIWRSMGTRAWPTLLFIDPEGKAVGKHEGELTFEMADRVVTAMLAEYQAEGVLDESPVDLGQPERPPASPLSFPGKLLFDSAGQRLFVSDTNHNRILELGLDGGIRRFIGTGLQGWEDGPSDAATFDHPQGLALAGDHLYVADTQNHVVRAINLSTGEVRTVAGTGVQSYQRLPGGPALRTAFASPWDLAWDGTRLIVSMAGKHQVWLYDPRTEEVAVFAGAGDEGLRDGPRRGAALAQTCGVALDGDTLWFADSETSSIRSIDGNGVVQTHVGLGLFDFGDVDATGLAALLQHPQGICTLDGKVYVTDTYNNKIKRYDPATGACDTFAGTGEAGFAGGRGREARFHEPAGIAAGDGWLWVADTNNHAIRMIDVASGEVSTLEVR